MCGDTKTLYVGPLIRLREVAQEWTAWEGLSSHRKLWFSPTWNRSAFA